MGGLLRTEAVLGVGVLVFAATLVGVAQGRGQPLPAQRGSVLAGPAFANAVVGGGLVRVALSPAAPGRNRLTAFLANPVEAATAGGVQPSAGSPSAEQEKVSVSLKCDCATAPVEAELTRAAGAWRTDVELPEAGVWRASLTIGGGTSLAPVALRVATGAAPGAPPYEISSIGDLSGGAARRCRSFQLGLVLALGFVNAQGGVGGRKVVVHALDDGGDPARARELAETDRDAELAVPCGPTAAVTAGVLSRHMPVVVADALAPPVNGERVFRLSGDPYAEGWAAGRTVARTVFPGRPDAPRQISVVVEGDDPGRGRIVDGLRAALALDPALAAEVEGTKPPPTADVEVVVRTHEPGTPLFPVVQEAVIGDRYTASFLAAEPVALAAALDSLSDREIVSNPALLVASRSFDENFLRGSKIGRRGDVRVYGEVAPGHGRLAPVHEAGVVHRPGGAGHRRRAPGVPGRQDHPGRPGEGLVHRQPRQEPQGPEPVEVRGPAGPPGRARLGLEPGRPGGGLVALPPLQGQLHPRRPHPRPGSRPGPVLCRGRRLEPRRHRQRRPVRAAALVRRPATRMHRPAEEVTRAAEEVSTAPRSGFVGQPGLMILFSRRNRSSVFSLERPVTWTRPANELKLSTGALTSWPSARMASRLP